MAMVKRTVVVGPSGAVTGGLIGSVPEPAHSVGWTAGAPGVHFLADTIFRDGPSGG
jgi:hypothetical protein